MLLMIGTQSAIVRTTPFHRRVVNLRHFRWLDEYLAAAAIVIYVIGEKHVLASVLWAPLHHENGVVAEDDLAFYLAEAGRADRKRDVIIQIRPDSVWHSLTFRQRFTPRQRLHNSEQITRVIDQHQQASDLNDRNPE